MQLQNISVPETVEDLLTLWLNEQKARVKASSYSTYQHIIHSRLLPWWGKRLLSEIGQNLITEFVEEMRRQGKAEKSIYDAVNILGAAFRYGYQRYQLANPLQGYRCRKKLSQSTRTLSRAEQKRLEAFLNEHQTSKNLGILLALYTGLRIGEVCALRWGDIDLRSRCITIERTVQRIQTSPGTTSLYFGTPKSTASIRQVPIASTLLDALISACLGHSPEDYLLSGNPECIEPRTYQYHCKKIFLAAGLSDDIHFHTLRHTFATRCVEANVNVKALSTRSCRSLSPTSPAVTWREIRSICAAGRRLTRKTPPTTLPLSIPTAATSRSCPLSIPMKRSCWILRRTDKGDCGAYF